MKKIFTLIAMTLMAVGANADTLINFSVSDTGITLSGSSSKTTVKIHENTDAVACLNLANGYTTQGALNDNYILLEVNGGFKTGDKVVIAGAFNNSDNSKTSAVDIFITDSSEKGYSVLHTTDKFINGRNAGDPVEETYTLEADADKLYLGRNGNTGTNITTLKVIRNSTDGITRVLDVKVANGAIYNLAGQKVDKSFKGVVIQNGKKMIQK